MIARQALRAAPSAAACVPALAALVEVAGELREDDLGGTGAARARRLLDEAIRYLRAASLELPSGSEDHRMTLFLLARACRCRDHDTGPVPDLDDAIACLRRLRAALPSGGPDLAEVEVLLADALLNRAVRAGGRIADVDEAGDILGSVLDGLPPDHPGRRTVAAALAMAHAVRYAMFGGTGTDRDDAAAYAAACLSQRDEPDEPATTAHLVLAWVALTRQHTPEQRSSMLMRAEIEAARTDAEASARLLARLGEAEISRADAEIAVDHLRQIPAGGGNAALHTTVPLLWALAQLAILRAGGPDAEVGPVVDDLASMAADPAAAGPERGELLALRAALLAARSQARPAGDGREPAVAALGEAVSGLPAGHLLRSPVLSMLTGLLTRQPAATGPADDLTARLDEAAAVLDWLPPDDPEATRAMAVIGTHILSATVTNRSVLGDDRFIAQFKRLVAGVAPGDPLALVGEFLLGSARYAQAIMRRESEDADAALSELIQRADSVPAGHEARPFVLAGVAIAYVERHGMNGELRLLDLADKRINQALAEADAPGSPYGTGTQLHGHLLHVRGHLGVLRLAYDRNLPRLTEAIADLELAETELGPELATQLGVVSALETARMQRAELATPSGPGMPLNAETSDALDRLREAAENAGRDRFDYPVLAAQAAAGLVMRGLSTGDVALVDQGIALLADTCAIPGLGLRERPRMLQAHGYALHTRYAMTRDKRDLSNAIARLEEARRAVEQEPGSPYAGSVLQSLADAYRTRDNRALGDVDRAVRIGLAALREHAGDVLLQDNDDNALHMARRGTSDATEMARWFLAHDRGDAAITALELGRGMVLHAATSGTGVADALTEAGHPDMAAEWTGRTGESGDDDLRYQAMLTLEGTPAEARLLSPPTAGDLAAALAGTGADALAYLIPREDSGPGIGVLVDRAGTVSWLPLPQLRAGPGSPVGEFQRARQAWERALEAPADEAAQAAARAEWLDGLAAVCDWAWQAAIGPLLRAVPAPDGRTSARDARGAARIVLVPGGELGLVPWHAARRPAGESLARREYACHHAVISYASSARQFMDAARRRVRPWAQAPVLVSDAEISLIYSEVEIAHLYAAHYAAGAVYGCAHGRLGASTPGDAAASRDDVLAALPHGASPGASLLHFGCHGRVSVPVLGSSLRLGADPRGEDVSVSVRDILRQARTAQAQEREGGGLVVLAACVTDVTEADYDEALTLATAFLAAGSTGVVAARWSVPDVPTALFMAAFHRFLNSGNGGHADPAHALRQAQLWMLDPDREVPDSWPRMLRQEADIDGEPYGPDLTSIEAWAGFAYQGR
jgi:tetratricopeptide (TPR) repeat protein